jgi:hypothetical protein
MSRARVVLAAVLVALVVAGIAVATSQRNFSVHASGAFEVPVRDTRAQGQAIFHLSHDGESLSYRLNVANIENVVQAHIHTAAPGFNGPIVVWLYPSTTPDELAPAGGGPIQGSIATGVITEADLVGPLLEDKTIADLVALLQSGNAYVNVHTNDGVDPANTGPGDFPGGEIRGNF